MGPGDDLAVVCLQAQRQRRLACRLGGMPVAAVVFKAAHEQGHPPGKNEDLPVLPERDALSLERCDAARP